MQTIDTLHNKELSDLRVKEMMISSEKVAHVQLKNPLEHALLILVKSGYSAVPVLDSAYKLMGTINKTAILNQTLGLEQFEVGKLSDMRVEEAMDTDAPTLSEADHFADALKKVINHPFVCVTDDDNYFSGIITRRAILKAVQRDYYKDYPNQLT